MLGLNDGGAEADSDDEEDGVVDDVMGLEDDDGDDYGEDVEEEAEEMASGTADKHGQEDGQPGSKGWRGADFYGGDDAGDDSDGSEEELVLEEARKLEERRLARIRGETDVLGSLLGPADANAESTELTGDKTAEGVTDTAVEGAAAAKFESVFADQAERSSVTRDVSKLSEAKRRSIIKKEAPELAPLLEDFRTKLESYREVAPLLQSPALGRFQSSGKAYLEAKASLLLNTMANLSYYLLVRAEGGTVRAHPVVSQLVWLRELCEQLKSLDQQLSPKLKRALKAAVRLAKGESTSGSLHVDAEKVANVLPAADAKVEAKPSRHSLRQRLDSLKALVAKEKATTTGGVSTSAGIAALDTDELLRLPVATGANGKAQRRKKKAGAADAPEDLDEVDPTLGAWMPSMSLNEHLTSVKQQLGEQAARSRPESAELNVEARPRRARTRAVESPDAPIPGGRGPIGEMPQEVSADDMGVEDAESTALLQQVTQAAKLKKDRKAAEKKAEQEDVRWRQHHPEEEVDGRRDTSKRILENRGLVRQRKKKSGNARLVNRGKYEKSLKKRKSQVQEMREGADDGTYKGEETGLRTHLRKSLRLS